MTEEKKEEKEKRNVVIILVAVSLIIFAFLWRFVIFPSEVEYVSPPTIKIAPKIDFEYLSSPEFKYFEEYEQITPLDEEEMGRENPFLPY